MPIRLATKSDFHRFFHIPAPEVWTALALERDGLILGIAGVIYSEDGLAVGFLDSKVALPRSVHRSALRFLDVMRSVGEKRIITYCDNSIAGAAKWLERLGFMKTSDTVEGQEVWEWLPDRPPPGLQRKN